MRGGSVQPKRMRGGGMAKMASKKKMMRGGWQRKRNEEASSKILLGWALLYMGKPFTAIGNWFWKMHKRVLDWNDNARP